MIDFEFGLPTKIIFGRDKENEVGTIINKYGYKKVLVHFGKGSVIRSGLLSRVEKSLKENNIDYILVGGVEANPKASFVKEVLTIAHQQNIDFILAIGGGSVIDSAKSIAVGYYYDGDPFDFNLHKVTPTKALPIGTILTISAAGSEMSSSCVISNEETKIKRGFNSELVRPIFSIMNPTLTYSVSPYQTACGIVDIMMHSMERYFAPSSEIELCDTFALGICKTVYEAGKKVMQDPLDYEARAPLMLASSFSHNDVTNIGKVKIMPVHALEHVLSGVYDHVAHGAGLAVLFPAWAEVVYENDIDKFAQFAHYVFGISLTDSKECAKMGIVKLKEFYQSIGMPASYRDLGITEDIDLDLFWNLLSNGGTFLPNSLGGPLDKDKATKIFSLCR